MRHRAKMFSVEAKRRSVPRPASRRFGAPPEQARGMRQNRHPAIAAVGIAFGLFPPLTAADLYLSADRSGILPINATLITFLCLSSTFGLILFTAIVRDRGRGLCLTYLATAPVLVVFLLLTMVQLA